MKKSKDNHSSILLFQELGSDIWSFLVERDQRSRIMIQRSNTLVFFLTFSKNIQEFYKF